MKYVLFAALAAAGIFLLYILLLVVSALAVNGRREYGTNSRYYRFLLNSSTAIGMKILRVKVHLTGEEKIPKGKRFLLVENHRSNYDPIVTWRALPGYDVAFISKSDNFKVPVWGRLIRRCGFLAIDRSSPRSSMETLNRAAKMIKDGTVSFGIYPEGTRNKTDRLLLPFHNGVFMAAHKAACPVVVVAVRGTDKIYKQYIRRRTDVYLDVIDVISPEEHSSLRTGDVGARVKADFENFLGSGDIND